MAIYRGDGGAGDATNDVTVNQIAELRLETQIDAAAAASSATDAETSASEASTSATNAANSATSAGTSATNAASSASSASTSASNASTSETNAAASETAAAASEAAAALSETAAASSETNAATSATNAATSETNASNSETAAASSAGVAALNATSAADSASSAATSASSAATSASNASASADAALSALDNFDDRYLGQKTSDPTTDNDGDALVAGALYFNTTDDVMKVYEGSTWVAAYASLSGALLASNNLSDLNNVSTARTNLGLGTAATTASTDYVAVTGGTMTGDLSFGDNDKAIFGAGSDLQIYHDGSNSYIQDAGTGNLLIRGANVEITTAIGTKYFDGAANIARLYHTGNEKLATAAAGIAVTGTVTADGASLDGAVVINESGANVDFRIESDTNATAFFLEGSSGNVGIGTTSPTAILHTRATNPVLTADGSAFASSSDGTGFGIYRSASGRAAGYTWTIENAISAGGSSASDYQTDNLLFKGRASITDTTLTEHMRITPSGNVGIGTASPSTTLDVNGAATIDGIRLEDSSDRPGLLEINRVGTTSFTGTQVNFSSTAIWSFMGGTTLCGIYDDYNSDWILQYTQNAGVRLYYDGSVKLNTTSIGVSVTGSLTASGDVTAYSDERLKENWKDLPEGFVANLAGVKSGTYNRIDLDGKQQVGVSAQSLQTVLPDAVIESNDTLAVNYGNAALASAIELAKKVVELEARIKELEGK